MSLTTKMPTIYLPHGGGPWPFMDATAMASPSETQALAAYLKDIPAQLPQRPLAMVVISAHWEAPVPSVLTNPRPPMLYDYYGFPPETYRIQWPAPGHPALAGRVQTLLTAANIGSAQDEVRGFDHGTFVPLKLAIPDADIPTIQLSLQRGLDPAVHLAIGRALAPLRDEGVLLVGCGMSYHNMRGFGHAESQSHAEAFDQWLRQTVARDPAARDADLVRWASAPSARQAHPREEHLMPLMVVAGAAGVDAGTVPYSGTFAHCRISAVHFGA